MADECGALKSSKFTRGLPICARVRWPNDGPSLITACPVGIEEKDAMNSLELRETMFTDATLLRRRGRPQSGSLSAIRAGAGSGPHRVRSQRRLDRYHPNQEVLADVSGIAPAVGVLVGCGGGVDHVVSVAVGAAVSLGVEIDVGV